LSFIYHFQYLDSNIGAMKGMSEREYVAHSGLPRGGVQKARKNGRLVVRDDGSINAAASDVRREEMTDPDQQRRSLGGDGLASGPGDTTSYIKARTALTVYAAQERQLAVQKKKGTLIDRARAETLVFRLARQERDVWVTRPLPRGRSRGRALRRRDRRLHGRGHGGRLRPDPAYHNALVRDQVIRAEPLQEEVSAHVSKTAAR